MRKHSKTETLNMFCQCKGIRHIDYEVNIWHLYMPICVLCNIACIAKGPILHPNTVLDSSGADKLLEQTDKTHSIDPQKAAYLSFCLQPSIAPCTFGRGRKQSAHTFCKKWSKQRKSKIAWHLASQSGYEGLLSDRKADQTFD